MTDRIEHLEIIAAILAAGQSPRTTDLKAVVDRYFEILEALRQRKAEGRKPPYSPYEGKARRPKAAG